MKRGIPKSRGVGMLLAVGLIAWGAGHPATASSDSSCSQRTLKGTYMYNCHGVQGSGQIDFAAAGKEQYHGDGTLDGVITSTDKDNVSHDVSYTGTYTVNSDCTATYTVTDENGVVTHADLFLPRDGSEIDVVLTDPGFVDSLVERRVGN
jgi:hypothetical protein